MQKGASKMSKIRRVEYRDVGPLRGADYPEGELGAYRHTYFPTERFSRLVARIVPWDPKNQTVYATTSAVACLCVGSYAITPTGSFAFLPTAELVAWVARNMVQIEWDTTYFELVARGRGLWALHIKYNRILGSRALREFRTEELPLRLRQALAGHGLIAT